MEEISKTLLKWYDEHHRDLPWRKTNDPYKIWVSEIILQQTRVDQGLPYYLTFIERFPDILTLAGASEDDILKTWQGLGYYSRARNMHSAAKMVVNEMQGEFPEKMDQLLKLPGVGPYTAAAIGSFAFDLPEPVIDGNVQRVVSRLFSIRAPVNTAKGENEIRTAINSIFYTEDPASFNQAIMEFGALQCVPQSPDCSSCPLQWNCIAFETQKVADLPVKKRKQKVSTRYLNYFVPLFEGQTVLEKRTGDGIWKNLFQFPVFESTDRNNWTIGADGFAEALNLKEGTLPGIHIIEETEHVHLLSHQRLKIRFIIVKTDDPLSLDMDRFVLTPINRILSNFAVPRIIEKFVSNAGWK